MAPSDAASAAEAALGIATRLSDPSAESTVRKGLELLRDEASGPRAAEVLRALTRAAPDWAPLLAVWEHQASHHAGGENQAPLLLAVAACLDACGDAPEDGAGGAAEDDASGRRKLSSGPARASADGGAGAGEAGAPSLRAFGRDLARSVPQRWLRTVSSALASGQYSRQAAALELLAAVARFPDPAAQLELLARWDYGHSALVDVARAWRAGKIVRDQAQDDGRRGGKRSARRAGGAAADGPAEAAVARPLSPAQLYRRWYSRDPLKRPLRALYASFAVASLRAALASPSRSALAALLSRRQPGNPASLLLAGTASDPPAAAREALETVAACLAKRPGASAGGRGANARGAGAGTGASGELSAPLLRPLWSVAGLRALWEIAGRDEDEDAVAKMLAEDERDAKEARKASKKRSRDAAALTPEVLAARPPVALAQRLLRLACLDPSAGLASAVGDGGEGRRTAEASQGAATSAGPGPAGSLLAITAGQRTLLRFFAALRPGTLPFGDELLVAACLRDRPLACATLAEVAPSWSLEPAPTAAYLCSAALLAGTLPAAAAAAADLAAAGVEQLLSGAGGPGASPRALAAQLAALALPPAAAARAPLSRGLQHADGLVRLSTLRVLRALLDGLGRVRRAVAEAAAGGRGGGAFDVAAAAAGGEEGAAAAAGGEEGAAAAAAAAWRRDPLALSASGNASLTAGARLDGSGFSEALVTLATARLPDPQLLLSARLAAERGRKSSDGFASLAEHSLLATLRAWRLALPEALVTSRVDVGKVAAALGKAALPGGGGGGETPSPDAGGASAGDPRSVDAACGLLAADLFASGRPPARTFAATLAVSPPLPLPQHLPDVALLATSAPRSAARAAARAWLIERLAATRLCEPEDAAAWALCLPRDEPAAAALLAGAAARAARQAAALVPRAGALGALSLAAALDACALERAAAAKRGRGEDASAAARAAGYVKATLAVVVSARPGAKEALTVSCNAVARAERSADAPEDEEEREKAFALQAFAADALSLADAAREETRGFRALLAAQRGDLGRGDEERSRVPAPAPQPCAPLGDASSSPEGASVAALAFEPGAVDAVALTRTLHRPSDGLAGGAASEPLAAPRAPAPLPGPWARSAAMALLAGLAGNRLAASRSLDEAVRCASDVDIVFHGARHGGVRAECLARALAWIAAGLQTACGAATPAPGCLLPACLLATRCRAPEGGLRAATAPLVGAVLAALSSSPPPPATTSAELALCLAAAAPAGDPALLVRCVEAALGAALRGEPADAPSPLPAAAFDLLAAAAEAGPERRRALAQRSRSLLPLATQLLSSRASPTAAAAAWAALLGGAPSSSPERADAEPSASVHVAGSPSLSATGRAAGPPNPPGRSARGDSLGPLRRSSSGRGDALAAAAAEALLADATAHRALVDLLPTGGAAAMRAAGEVCFDSAEVRAAFAGALDALAAGELHRPSGGAAPDVALRLEVAEAALEAAAACLEVAPALAGPRRDDARPIDVAPLAEAATRAAAAALTGSLGVAPSARLIASARACLAAAVRSGKAGAAPIATEALKRVCRRLKRGDRGSGDVTSPATDAASLLAAGTALLPLCAACDASVASKALTTLSGAVSKLAAAQDADEEVVAAVVPLARAASAVVRASTDPSQALDCSRLGALLAACGSLIVDVCCSSGRLADRFQAGSKRASKAGGAGAELGVLDTCTAAVSGLDSASDLAVAVLDAVPDGSASPLPAALLESVRRLAVAFFSAVAGASAFVPALRDASASPPPLPTSAAEAPRPPPSALLLLPPGGPDEAWTSDPSLDARAPAGLKRASARAVALALVLDRRAAAGLVSTSAARSPAALAPLVSTAAGLAVPAASALLKMLLAAYGASMSAADRAVWAGIRELNLRLWCAERIDECASLGWGGAGCEEAVTALSFGSAADAPGCRALLEGPLAKAGFAWGSAAKAAVTEGEASGGASPDAAVAAVDSVRCALSVARFPAWGTALGLEGVRAVGLDAGGAEAGSLSSELPFVPALPAAVDPAAVLPAALCALRSGASDATALSRCGVAALALRCLSARDDVLRGLASATLGRIAAEVRAQRGMAWWVGGEEEEGPDDAATMGGLHRGSDPGRAADASEGDDADVIVPVLFSEDPSNKARDAKESRAQRRRRLDPPRRSHEERFARPEASLAPACRERVPLGLALQRAALSAELPGARLSPAAAVASAEAALAAPHPEHELFAHLCRAAAVGAPSFRAGDPEPLLAKHAVSGRPEAVAPRRWALRALRAAGEEVAQDACSDEAFALAARAMRRSGSAQLAVVAAEAAPWRSAAAEDAEAAAAAATAAVGPGAASAAGLVGWLADKAAVAAEASALAREGSRVRGKAVERARRALRSLASVASRPEARGGAPPSRALRAELAAAALRVLEVQRGSGASALADEAFALAATVAAAEDSADRQAQADFGSADDAGGGVLRALTTRVLGAAVEAGEGLRV